MHSSLRTNTRSFRLTPEVANFDARELAKQLDLRFRPRGKSPGYEISDAFLFDAEGNLALIRVTRDIVSVARLYERVCMELERMGAQTYELPEMALG